MTHYTIFNDYEKQQKIREIKKESERLDKPVYWILKRMGIPRSTYYGWLDSGGISRSKAPKNVWNKTADWIEKKIIGIREDNGLLQSERSCIGIMAKLEKEGIFMDDSGIYKVLKRNGLSRRFVDRREPFIIYPKSNEFLGVVCIDDIGLTNRKPRELSVFNAIDEYSGMAVGILFVKHRINRFDVISLLKMIKKKYGRYPKAVRMDNAKAHLSILVKGFCEKKDIETQFIDKGTPQQNWPVESFNGVIQKDLLESSLWGGWMDFKDKQKRLERYARYYNDEKPLASDELMRTPHEIASGNTSPITQKRLKIRLIRKHYGQVAAHQAKIGHMQRNTVLMTNFLKKCKKSLSEMCVR
jgi:transposase InsO family protein